MARAASIAVQYQQKFRRDVFIDIVCYRRNGHNELDEPFFTQPLMYRAIKKKKTLPAAYAESLIEQEVWTQAQLKELARSEDESLEKAVANSKSFVPQVKMS